METAAAPVFAGIDVSKDKLDVAVRPSGETFTVDRNEEGLAELCRRLASLKPLTVASKSRAA